MPPAEPTTQDQPDPPGPDEPDSSALSAGGPSSPIQIETVCHARAADAGLAGWLSEQARLAVTLCEIPRAQLTIAVVADDEMARLHEQYAGVSGTTDVLTFDLARGGPPVGPSPDGSSIEGDIVVCLDEARRQAGQRDHEPRHELLLYVVHGLMHLIGEDDKNEDGYQRMHAREDALLKEMGFGPLFDPDRYTDPKP